MSGAALRVLMAAAGGTAGVVLPDDAVALTTAGNGGWNQQSDPHAVKHAGYTYVAWVDSSGNVECRSYEDSSGSLGTIKLLHATLSVDVHVSPSMLVRDSDHRLMVWYSAHNAAAMYMRISTNSLDSDPTLSGGFASEVNLDSQIAANEYTYPTVYQQLGQTNDPIYLWFRDRVSPTSYVSYSYSTDGGSTWSARFHLLANTGNVFAYFKVIGDGDERTDIITSDGHPIDDAPSKLYHQWADSSNWHKSDGTVIVASPPYAPTQGTEVYDGSDGSGWVMGVGFDGTDVATVYWTGTYGQSDMDVAYARWDGAAWDQHTVANENGGAGLLYAPGGAVLDASDIDRVYMARYDGSQWEMYVYTTTDDGATWSAHKITHGSSAPALWPANVVGYVGSGLRAAWLRGTITGEDTYSLAIEATTS